MEINKIYNGDVLEILKTLPNQSINMCVTSPPYYALRDYQTAKWEGGDINCDHKKEIKPSSEHIKKEGYRDAFRNSNARSNHSEEPHYKSICKKCGAVRIDKQIGLEETPEEYIQKLVDVFREVKRVLKDDGTLWINIGDSYNGSGKAGNNPEYQNKHTEFGKSSKHSERFGNPTNIKNLKPKDLIGIPWMLAFALRSDGWFLRQDIIWSKTNPMPESVTDRCTKSHEYIFLLSKNKQYYFDNESIKEPTVTYDNTLRDRETTKLNNTPGRTTMGGFSMGSIYKTI
jgi:DNA modification methylase